MFDPKDLDVRVHMCPYCELVLDRDVNAARNILREGIGMECADFTPVGDSTSTEEKPVMQVGSLNQEAHILRDG